MSDLTDLAQDLEERHRVAALAAARQRPAHGHSAEVCRGCGEDIPEQRRLAVPGVQTCAFCQSQTERR